MYNSDLTILRRLEEGGNVFKDANKRPVTQRIDKGAIGPSLAWVEEILGFKLDNWLGTTGKKESSGDIDVGVDSTKHDRKEVANHLRAWAKENGLKPKEWVALSGTNVHFKTPIRDASGKHTGGFAQLDLMFGNPDFMAWTLRGEPGTTYKGVHRQIIMASIAKAQGMKWSYLNGLMNRTTNDVISQDPKVIAQKLLPGATVKTFDSVENILNHIYKRMPERAEEFLADAFETLEQHHGITLPMPNQDAVNESNDVDEYFLARLRDRIVNMGMEPLFEGILLEGARIEHPEDLVFHEGTAGIQHAIDSLEDIAKTGGNVTIKWDGRPAIIYGRNERGEFVLTDKAGFGAKGYDGRATSVQDIKKMMSMRKGDRTELVGVYARLFPMLEKAIPKDFEGYVWADLLYSEKPKVANGKWTFTPNTVTYSVDRDSELGKRIGQTKAGVAIHTYIAPDGDKMPVSHIVNSLPKVPEVLQVDPYFTESPSVKLPSQYKAKLKSLMKYKNDIDGLLDPQQLRMLKISDFPNLMKRFVNAKVREGNFDHMVGEFLDWLPTFTTEGKLERMYNHMKANKKGLAAVFQSFIIVTKAKEHLVNQLDNHAGSVQASIGDEKGHEGYVAATDKGNIKLVDRLRFSRANFAQNN